MNLTATELAYLAGLFDGEGSIGYYKYADRYRAVVQIANNDPRIIKWLKDRISFGTISKNQGRSKFTGFVWSTRSTGNVIQFLRAIQPYLVVKRDQAELLLEFLDAEQVSRGVGDGKQLTLDDRCKRLSVVESLKTLKTASYVSIQ